MDTLILQKIEMAWGINKWVIRTRSEQRSPKSWQEATWKILRSWQQLAGRFYFSIMEGMMRFKTAIKVKLTTFQHWSVALTGRRTIIASWLSGYSLRLKLSGFWTLIRSQTRYRWLSKRSVTYFICLVTASDVTGVFWELLLPFYFSCMLIVRTMRFLVSIACVN